MAFNWRHPGLVWIEHTGENAAIAAAAAALGIISPGDQLHIAWLTVAAVSAKSALCAVLLAVVALGQRNGTASFLPRVVAEPKTASGETV